MVVLGNGPPLVLIPGIQGHWQWMRPAVRALAARFRVVTLSLAPLPREDAGLAGSSHFDRQVEQVAGALSAAGVERPIVCGVSYGGLIAVRLAATRRCLSALVLASTPAASWRPDARVNRYTGAPWLSAPAFFLGARERLWREISAARPNPGDRYRTMAGYLREVALHPPSPVAMARRVRALAGCNLVADARTIEVPTLVMMGEEQLDKVVPVAGTREYLSLIPGAEGFTLKGTGHIGLITKPDEFALAIADFVSRQLP